MLVDLNSNGLSGRHKELNAAVADAFNRKVKLSDLPTGQETDLDYIFKSELASKYKDVNYVLEELKCGDALRVSKAMNYDWLYEDEYSEIIDVYYLENNVFPSMSLKMKNKFVKLIATKLKDEVRAENFAEYYFNVKQNHGLGMKFLWNASHGFKLNFIENDANYNLWQLDDKTFMKYFIGESFILAESLLKHLNKYNMVTGFLSLRHLFNVSQEKYLNLLESNCSNQEYFYTKKFGKNFTKDIISRHKERVIRNKDMYCQILDMDLVASHLTVEEAKSLIVSTMPDGVEDFWTSHNFYDNFLKFVKLVPFGERFRFVKDAFHEKYSLEAEFEDRTDFYNKDLHIHLMTDSERETWALRLLDKEYYLGPGNEYQWYAFINFQKAFDDVKQMIHVTKDDRKRSNIINVLVQSAKSDADLVKLLDYYYNRHGNENIGNQLGFVLAVIDKFNINDFNDELWKALNKLLYKMEVYGQHPRTKHPEKIKMVALLYLVFNKQPVSLALDTFAKCEVLTYRENKMLRGFLDKMSAERKELLYQYLLTFIQTEIQTIKDTPTKTDKELGSEISKIWKKSFELAKLFNRDVPESLTLLKEQYPKDPTTTVGEVYRKLKTNTSATIMNDLKQLIKNNKWDSDNSKQYNNIMRKLKIYFGKDIAVELVQHINDLLNTDEMEGNDRRTHTLVCFLMHLAEPDVLKTLMTKYTPDDSKIQRDVIDPKYLDAQEAICRFMGYARPPLALDDIMKFIKGDYVQFCRDLFNMHMANLPLPLCLKFVERLLEQPVSIQKHGLRLTFKCFDIENLINVLDRVWKHTKNVSLRTIIFTSLADKIEERTLDENDRTECFNLIKTFTCDLNENDDDEIFQVIYSSSNMPEKYHTQLLELGWKMLESLPNKAVFWQRKANLIRSVNKIPELIDSDFVKDLVKEHVNRMLHDKEILSVHNTHSFEYAALNDNKWELTVSYICSSLTHVDEKLTMLKDIADKCMEIRDKVDKHNKYFIREFYEDLVKKIVSTCESSTTSKEHCNNIINILISSLLSNYRLPQCYIVLITLHIAKITKSAIIDLDHTHDPPGVGFRYGQELGQFIQKMVEENKYYLTFNEEISRIVAFTNYHYEKCRNYVTLCVVMGIITTPIKECYLQAVEMLPLSVAEVYKEEWTNVVTSLKNFDSDEVQAHLYVKFCNGYTVCRYI